jgi:O-antigen/teichoic acid export membrane protein
MNGDRLLLAGMVNASVLGMYTIAFLIFDSIYQMMTRIMTSVLFPALSEIARDRPVDLRVTYYRIQVVIASLAYFCSGLLMTSGQRLIGLLYDRRYEDAGWMLEILAAALLTVPFHIVTQCLMALGMPKLISHLGVVRLLAVFLFIPSGFKFFGLEGAIWGIVLSHFSWVPAAIYYQIKYRLFDLRKELFLLPVLFAGVATGTVIAHMIRH